MQRYSQFAQPLTTDDGSTVMSGLPYLELQYDGNVQFYEVQPQEAGRLDIIAYKFFQDSSLWPLIAWYNNLIDPMEECQPGVILNIPITTINQGQDIIPFTYEGTT
jgi:hypothetical protein